MYFFKTRAASVVYNMMYRNTYTGNEQPPGKTSPLEATMLCFPTCSGSEQPNYQNVNPNDQPLVLPIVTTSEIPSGASFNVELKKFQYKELVFDNPPEDHPVPLPTPNGYTQIDFDKTVEYNLERNFSLASSVRPRGSTSSMSSGRGREERVRSSRTQSRLILVTDLYRTVLVASHHSRVAINTGPEDRGPEDWGPEDPGTRGPKYLQSLA